MHELSIATAMLQVAREHVPAGCILCRVRMLAGPLQCIEPLAMTFAWNAVLQEEGLGEVQLELRTLPWQMKCPDCGRQWPS